MVDDFDDFLEIKKGQLESQINVAILQQEAGPSWWATFQELMGDGYWSGVGSTLKGYFVNPLVNLATGTFDLGVGAVQLSWGLATDFNNTMGEIWSFAEAIPSIPGLIWDDYVRKTKTLEGQGELAFDIVTLPIAIAKAYKGIQAAKAARKASKLARAAGKVEDVADAIPIAPRRVLNISGKQFGTKVGKRLNELGLDPSDAQLRYKMKSRIQRIFDNADEVRDGVFRGQGPDGTVGPVQFFRRGHDVVVATLDGDFVTLLTEGINNKFFINGVPIL